MNYIMAVEIERAASIAQDLIDKTNASKPEIHSMMSVVKKFIQTHRVMCYGGTAINNLLSKKNQFYDSEKDIPDYDFFSDEAQKHCVQLSNLLVKSGIENVEAKAGVHVGTYKVFADYTAVADISQLEDDVFDKLWRESIVKDGIHYVPPNFLRMSVYLELSRPRGYVERWKKVYTRLQLLNEEYPVVCPTTHKGVNEEVMTPEIKEKIEDLLLKEKVVLLGFNASTLQEHSSHEWKLPLDILADPDKSADITRQIVEIFGGRGKAKAREFEEYAELLPAHYDILDGKKLLVRVYETLACHSYQELSNGLRIASIPTLLNFFFAMLYADKEFVEHTSRQRLVCVAHRLVEMANNSKKRRFKLLTPISCIGKQKDLLDMRREKAEMYTKLSKNKNSREFMKYFFSYTPTRK
jgi:hypothetical protein